MSIFENLGSGSSRNRIIEPARLFRSLANRAEKFELPRDIQTEVWRKWFDRRDESDLVLKMNTGSGKTVVGLLILQSSLNEGLDTAVYLVPDRHLQKQVVDTASALDLAHTTDPDDPEFRRGRSILIVTVSRLFNGRSKFGVRGSSAVNRRIDIGALVVDDAHAAIPIIEQQFSMRIPRDISSGAPYRQMLDLFADELKAQSLAGWNDLSSGESSTVVPVPYWAWHDKLSGATQILAGQATDDENQWKWPLLKDQLALAEAAFTPAELEVGLRVPYLESIPSFGTSRRRIYMTATLADDSIMVSKFGAEPSSILNPVTPDSASDLGDRMILTPLETSRAIDLEDVQRMVVDLSSQYNCVVLVPSKYRAQKWAPYTSEIHNKDSISECVQRLTRGHVGLVVLIAKYDGVDLPGNACRVLVIDGLPERYSPLERSEASALGDTDAIRTNQIQRIEQGMGRAIRSATDYSAVILLDPRLVQRLDRVADRSLLSPGTRAQLELSQDFATSSLRGEPIEKFRLAIDSFLSRDTAWTVEAKRVIDNLPFATLGAIADEVVAARAGYEEAIAGRWQAAFDKAIAGVESIGSAEERGWARQAAASYLYKVNPMRAREVQRAALVESNYLLRQSEAITTPRITLAGQQADQSAAQIASVLDNGGGFLLHVESLLAGLVPTPERGSHKTFEKSMHELGLLLGFSSTRPDSDDRVGPDVLWAIGADRYWVIECKSESTTTEISRSDLEQLSHSIDWFDRQYPDTRFVATPVLIHNSRKPSFDAVPRQGARAISFTKLSDFRAAVRGWAESLEVDFGYRNTSSIKEALVHFHLAGNQIHQQWTQKFKD